VEVEERRKGGQPESSGGVEGNILPGKTREGDNITPAPAGRTISRSLPGGSEERKKGK